MLGSRIPTGKQQERFWVWCGFQMRFPQWGGYDLAGISTGYYFPNGTPPPGAFYITDLPEITLSNLFQWALPKVKKRPDWETVLREWMDNPTDDQHKDALALFWAIWEVIK